ncbi:MAG: 1-deoxy-D-xylulose-5-phosphate reductoisomerase [Phycisphaerae bacterium]|nr:1-deoxy-D-xylulose-5-phosphate reductoisomerase [Phycisphaerae bacterium]
MSKRIAILGSTGSIGRQALDVIAAHEDLTVCALAAGRNAALLGEQARTFAPDCVALALEGERSLLRTELPEGTELLTGPESLTEIVWRAHPDVLLTAVVGTAGLAPTLAGIACGATLAVANKEALVAAGGLVMPAARAAGVDVLPVDSEHSAIFQCLAAGRRDEVRRVVLTASGGALRDWDPAAVADAGVDDALNHPTWDMGRKITIDSATLVNKAMEIVEAHWLFDLSADEIDVVLHGESIVHSCVEYQDGSMLAQLGRPEMTTPIAYALNYPRRRPCPGEPLDLAALGSLTFSRPTGRFADAVELGFDVIRRGGAAGAALIGANDAAVAAFCEGAIAFGDIVPLVGQTLARCEPIEEVTLEALLAAEAQARREVAARVSSRTVRTD